MRRRLWFQFHLWTGGIIFLLSVANFAFITRNPFARAGARNGTSITLASNIPSSDSGDRFPASASNEESKFTLKVARIGCEPHQRLRVAEAIRQIRLQFDTCATKEKSDTVVSVRNATNDFDATVFGADLAPVSAEPPAHLQTGTFSPNNSDADRAPASKLAPVSQKTVSLKTESAEKSISTDYITLAPGGNELKIQRSNREQRLEILRK